MTTHPKPPTWAQTCRWSGLDYVMAGFVPPLLAPQHIVEEYYAALACVRAQDDEEGTL